MSAPLSGKIQYSNKYLTFIKSYFVLVIIILNSLLLYFYSVFTNRYCFHCKDERTKALAGFSTYLFSSHNL